MILQEIIRFQIMSQYIHVHDDRKVTEHCKIYVNYNVRHVIISYVVIQ